LIWLAVMEVSTIEFASGNRWWFCGHRFVYLLIRLGWPMRNPHEIRGSRVWSGMLLPFALAGLHIGQSHGSIHLEHHPPFNTVD
jgi:hypothetical protein